MKKASIYLLWASLGICLFFWKPIFSQSEERALFEAYPSDEKTEVLKSFASKNDEEFLSAYIKLSSLEQLELSHSLQVLPESLEAITTLRRLRYNFSEKIADLMKWNLEKIDPLKSETYVQLVPLTLNTKKMALIFYRSNCVKGSEDFTLPPRSDRRELKVGQLLPEVPTDWQQSCDRKLEILVQGLNAKKLKRERLTLLPHAQLAQMWRGEEQRRMLIRLWYTLEQWESDNSAKMAERLRSIEVLTQNYDLSRSHRFVQLANFVTELANQNFKELEICAVLKSFYQSSKFDSSALKDNLGNCAQKDLGFSLAQSHSLSSEFLKEITQLPPWDKQLLSKSGVDETFANDLRALYVEGLQVLFSHKNTLPEKDFKKFKHEVEGLLKGFYLSALAGQLYQRYLNEGNLDWDIEAYSVLKKKRSLASLSSKKTWEINVMRKQIEVLSFFVSQIQTQQYEEAVLFKKHAQVFLSLHQSLDKALKAP